MELRKVENVTFIIIARNEEYAVNLCLKSIVSMPLENCEIICIDSESNDNTLSVIKKYKETSPIVQVYKCAGKLNAAIARNIGLQHVTKEYVFFVDGDIELKEYFTLRALELIKANKADAVTGQLREIIYSPDYKKMIKRTSDRFNIRKEKKIYFCGGSFITCTSILKITGAWNEHMPINEDFDYTLRLSRNGNMIAIPIPMGIHHTLEYKERTLLHLRNAFPIYYGMLIRKSILRPKALITILYATKGLFFGVFLYSMSIIGLIVGNILNIAFICLFAAIIFIFLTDFLIGFIKRQGLLDRFIRHYLYVPIIIYGTFKKEKRSDINIKIEKI
jgi:glycosyltransferase involved in cell wall biosynthesis